VDFGGNAVRLLVKDRAAGELIAAGKPPGGEYSAILTVARDSWSSETPVSELTVALPQIELLPEWELRDFPVSESQARRSGTMRNLAGFDQIDACYALNAARNWSDIAIIYS
jgi:hypothetical protein